MGNRGAIAAGDIQWMTAGSGIIHQEMPKGDRCGPHARVSVVGQSSGVAQNDRAALPGSESGRHSRDHATTTARTCASSAEASGARQGPVDGIAADPIYLDVSVPPGRTQDPARRDHASRLRVCLRGRRASSATRPVRSPCRPKPSAGPDTTPPTEADNRSLVLFDRGDEVMVQAGRGRHPVPAGLRKAAGGARGLVWTDRDEHAGAAPAGVRGARKGHVPEDHTMNEAKICDPRRRDGRRVRRQAVGRSWD